ncbi:MAG: hypothetical protein M5U09_30425 [Gammaproteobacteria bacterium]|nr:hypothetical protein [Gammaproteobacteria bacterium]
MLVHLYERRAAATRSPTSSGCSPSAIWDAPRRRLLLARDRMGQKPPLYITPNRRAAASRSAPSSRALMEHPAVECVVDSLAPPQVPALRLGARAGHHPSPASMAPVGRVARPGRTGTSRPPPTGTRPHPDPAALRATSATRLGPLLWERLARDTRGCASSPTCRWACSLGRHRLDDGRRADGRAAPPDRIKTSSIGFENKSFDESSFAREVAPVVRHRPPRGGPLAGDDARPAPRHPGHERALADGSVVPTLPAGALHPPPRDGRPGRRRRRRAAPGLPDLQAHQVARALAPAATPALARRRLAGRPPPAGQHRQHLLRFSR